MLLLNSSGNIVCRCCCRTSQNHIDFVQPLETVKIHVLCNKNTSGMFQPAMKASNYWETCGEQGHIC